MSLVKKIVTYCVLILVMSSMIGCAKNDSTKVDTTSVEVSKDEKVTKETESSNTAEQKDEKVEISFLNTKNDISEQVIEATKKFTEKYPNISINVLSTDGSPVEKASTLYASGTAATLTMLDSGDIVRFADKALDLSGEKWVQDLAQVNKLDGKVLSFPFSVEGYGFIYNQDVLDRAVGGIFDPTTINTQSAFEELLVKIQAIGVEPYVIGSMNWSLGNHFLAISYAAQDDTDVTGMISKLKKGTADFVNNKAFNGLMDTFDIMKKYNMAKNDPMAFDYAESLGPVARGEAGITFNGNWAMLEIQKSNPEGKFGFMPVPVSNEATAPYNNAIAIGATKQIFIDQEMSTPEQQAAAKLFLEWIVYDEAGQDFMVNKSNIVMGFTNVEISPSSSLAQAIVEYNNAGKSNSFAGNYVPADHWEVLGATMQKYLSDIIDREQVAKEVEEYWSNVE
jgi:raffinose/stachyose/melibiose transport system substrate-binding protein